APHERRETPRKLADFIRVSELTEWLTTGAALTSMSSLGALTQGDFPTLKHVMWYGDVAPGVLAYWMTRAPHVAFTQLYRSADAAIASGYHTSRHSPAR